LIFRVLKNIAKIYPEKGVCFYNKFIYFCIMHFKQIKAKKSSELTAAKRRAAGNNAGPDQALQHELTELSEQ